MPIIYEANESETIPQAADKALEAGCQKFLLDGVLYSVELKIEELGRIEKEGKKAEKPSISFPEMSTKKLKIGEILVNNGYMSEKARGEVLDIQEAQTSSRRFGDIAIDLEVISYENLAKALSLQFQMLYIGLDKIQIDVDVIEMLAPEIAREHQILPISYDNDVLRIAMFDPLDLYTLDNLRFVVNAQVEPCVAAKDQIQSLIAQFYGWYEDDYVVDEGALFVMGSE
jgi:hypothetical protein